MRGSIARAVCSAALLAGSAQAQQVFTVSMNGAQVPTASSFTGSGTVTLNAAETQITVAITHDVPSPTGGHIHEAPPGVDGGIVFPFSGFGASPINQVFSISQAQVAVLRAGNYYVNIHTASFPNGEIRGQILPQSTDTDQDLLDDSVETNTGTFVSANDTGTDPNNPDTDGDGVLDGIEVELGRDPNNALDFPILPTNPMYLLLGIGGVAVVGLTVRTKRSKRTL